MQYDAIILELMGRIKNLEEEVSTMKQWQDTIQNTLLAENQGKNQQEKIRNSDNAYQKMTDEMIDICYKCGKKFNQGKNLQELADDINCETSMNRNSAVMYLYAVDGMLNGTIYKRAINSKAMKRYFDTIFNEYGSDGLKRAINATRLHIEYRRECGQQVDSIEEICHNYERKL